MTTAEAAPLTYQLLGTHPQAAVQGTNRGKTIHDLKVHNGKIIAGYGDYNDNTGPIVINPFDIENGTFDGSQLSVPTEEINRIRLINGKIYIPTVDPVGCLMCAAGYVVGEPWELKEPIDAVHVYDVASLDGTDLWLAGSASGTPDGAYIWRSTDGGDTWSVVETGDGGDYERFYWLAAVNNKMYAQAVDPLGDLPIRIFNGSSWATGPNVLFARGGLSAETFQGKIVTHDYTGPRVINGETDEVTDYTGYGLNHMTPDAVKDMEVTDDYAYFLLEDTTVVRTSNFIDWQDLGTSVSTANSLTVDNGTIYIGTTDSKLYKSVGTIPAMPTIVVSSPVANATVSGKINLQTSISSDEDIESVTYKRGSTTIGTITTSPFTIEWDTGNTPNGSYQITASLVTANGTNITSAPIAVNLSNSSETSDTPEETSESINSSIIQVVSVLRRGVNSTLAHIPGNKTMANPSHDERQSNSGAANAPTQELADQVPKKENVHSFWKVAGLIGGGLLLIGIGLRLLGMIIFTTIP